MVTLVAWKIAGQ